MAIFKTATKNTSDEPKSKKTESVNGGMKTLYAEENAKNAGAEKKTNSNNPSQAYRVLVRPLISEKASHQQSLNQYFFAVALNANRIEVAKAVKDVYGVTPIKVNIIRSEGKTRRIGSTIGRRKDWKKAMVTLPKGKTISLYEGV
jgi:large subunit ribosomal protein L23